MGFDPIQHAMCDDNVKQEVKRQRLFGVDEHKISARASDITNDEFFYGPIGFSYISELTPTKEEIEKGEIYIPFGDEKLKLRIGKVLFDNELVYGGQVYQGNSVSETYLAIAYKLGEIDGFNIPKTGVYLHVEDNTSSELFFVIEYETIHPIDPKFIPGAPLFDLTKIGLPAVQLNSSVMVETTDVSEISAAMDAGNIKIKTLASINGVEMDVYANLLSAYLPATQAREATTVLSFDGKIYAIILTVLPNYINFSISEV